MEYDESNIQRLHRLRVVPETPVGRQVYPLYQDISDEVMTTFKSIITILSGKHILQLQLFRPGPGSDTTWWGRTPGSGACSRYSSWSLGMLRIVELFSYHQWQSTWMSGGSDKPKKTKTALGTCFFASRLVVSGVEGEIQRKLSTKRKSLFSDSKLYLRRLKTSEMESWLNSDTFRPP